MSDKEKVINGLECCGMDSVSSCFECRYFDLKQTYGINACTTLLASDALELLKEQEPVPPKGMPDREKVIKTIEICYSEKHNCTECELFYVDDCNHELLCDILKLLKEQEPDVSKHQHKIDHTDCIWYSDSESRCPVTCSQYRDGWNDAMDFIFKNGAGYSPYKRW